MFDGEKEESASRRASEVSVPEASGKGQFTDDSSSLGLADALRRRHLLVGWWTLLSFLTLGLVLDVFHGLKVGWYLDVHHATRRMMWTLAHTHGTLIGLVHLAFAAAVTALPDWAPRRCLAASYCLVASGVLMPFGFLLGGLFIYGGDPGLGGFLVPPGAFC